MANKKKNVRVPSCIYDEEFEKIWEDALAGEARLVAKYEALPKEEKERLEKKFADPFYARISEDPLGDDDDDDSEKD